MSDELFFEIPKDTVEVPDGIYVVRLVAVERTESRKYTDADGRPQQQYRWVFEVVRVIDADSETADEAVGARLYAYTSTSLAPRARARGYIEALMGRSLEVGERFSAASLVGKLARATVKAVDGRARISELAPYRRGEQAVF